MEGITVGILLLATSSVIASLLVLDRESHSRLNLFSILLFASAVVFYIRTGFGRYFTTIDESYYVSLLGNPHWYLSSIVSGYITPVSLYLFRPFFATPADELVWYSVAMVVVYTIALFFFYQRLGLSQERSVLAVFVLFMTPLYIWSVIEVRPQQMGLLVGLLLTSLIFRGLRKKTEILLVLAIYFFLVFSHVLSFIVYSLLFIVYLSLRAFVFDDSEGIKTYRLLAPIIMFSWTVFLIFPYSHPILKNMTWLLNSISGLRLSVSGFSILSAVFLLVGLSLLYLVLLRFHGRLASPVQVFQRILMCISEDVEERKGPLLGVFTLVTILAIIYLQFRLGSSIYSWVYRGSLLALLLFQAGNIAFAIFYLLGIITALRRNNLGTFELLSLTMLLVSFLFLILSFFMPRGNGIWGFHNWFIRALQYFVPLAAPIVAGVVKSEVNLGGKSSRILISLLVGLLVTVSILNTARIPEIYNYDAVWSKELVVLCSKGGIYAPRISSSVYSHFVEDNLLKACSGTLELNFSPNADILMASNTFYRYSNRVKLLSIDSFIKTLSKNDRSSILIMSGDTKLNSFVATLFPSTHVIQLSPKEKCPLENIPLGRSIIIIGGPLANPCSYELEKTKAITVYLTANSIITPHSVYHVPTPNPWWNRKESLFVIQTLEYEGRALLIIEGTDCDSTLAGIYYFTNNILTLSSRRYVGIKYLIGKWKETDNKVLDVVKGSLEDSNGFSPGDKIILIETG